jgi:glycosyltransferase involved in cell wall biosynthesis
MSEKLKILACPANEGGCAYYRIIAPYNKLAELYPDKVEVRMDFNPLGMDAKTGQWIPDFKFENLKWADVVVVGNLSNFGGNYTARIVGKAKEFGKFVHYDTDDLLTDLYEGHRLYGVYKEKGLGDITKFIYHHSDLVSVTQKKFADRIKPYCKSVLAVIKNAVDYNLPCWNMPKPKIKKNYCRFGWAGGIHHEQDLHVFTGVPAMVNARVGIQNCRWDFIGHPPPDTSKDDWQIKVWENYRKHFTLGMKGPINWGIHYALPTDRYGIFFTQMDVALAPLEMNAFNDSKSEIKIAECGRYKIPLIASNVGCYDEWIVNGKTGFLIPPDAPKTEWVRILTLVAKNKELREGMGEELHKITEANFDLNKNVGFRLDLYNKLMRKVEVSANGQE